MPDISMCRNTRCERRLQCYRFTAIPNPFRQSYMNYNEVDCKSFDDNKGQIHKCKYIRKIGESCTLNNNCKFPHCENN